jgi:hypothetical protein
MFHSSGEAPYIPSVVLEEKLIDSISNYITTHQKLSVAPPSVIMVSFTGVQGYKLAVSQRLDNWHDHTHVIDREILLLPDIIVEDYSIDSATLLHPIFDAVWNSAGWPKSMGYNETGEWGKGPNFRR